VEQLANDQTLAPKDDDVPRFIAVEGPIGVGKTTLAKRLATSFNCETFLEKADENPFLERFYQDRRAGALPAQLYFLFQRTKQIQEIRQGDMFQQVRVSDFLIEKDGKRIALECKSNIGRDIEKTEAICALIQEQLNCSQVRIVLPYLEDEAVTDAVAVSGIGQLLQSNFNFGAS